MIETNPLTVARSLLAARVGAAVPKRTPAARRQPAAAGRPMPGPRGYPLIGVAPEIFRHESVLPLLRSAWQTYGDAARLPMGPYTLCFFAHPDAVKHILVDKRDNYVRSEIHRRWASRGLGSGLFFSVGEQHRRRRHLMHGPFTVKAIRGYATAVASAVQVVVEEWERRLADDRAEIDLSAEMTGLSMDALGR